LKDEGKSGLYICFYEEVPTMFVVLDLLCPDATTVRQSPGEKQSHRGKLLLPQSALQRNTQTFTIHTLLLIGSGDQATNSAMRLLEG
jgi:hypothetical protein